MQQLRRSRFRETRQKLCKIFRRTPEKRPIEPQFYCEIIPTPKLYTFYAVGKIWKTRKSAIHYFGIRPFVGATDPVLQDGLSLRAKLRPLLLAAEKQEANRKLVDALLQLPPTHVLRLGWRSMRTGVDHDILFIPLRFSYSGYSADKLARECAVGLSDLLSNTEFVGLLCPDQKSLRNAQMVWMSFLFFRFRGVTVDRNLKI